MASSSSSEKKSEKVEDRRNESGSGSGTTSNEDAFAFTESQKNDILSTHNRLRASLNLKPLKWDTTGTLDASAIAYAKSCTYGHFGPRKEPLKTTENICYPVVSTWGKNIDGATKECIKGTFDDEKTRQADKKCCDGHAQYLASNLKECTGPCGHYQNILDPRLTEIGGGIAFCPTLHNQQYVNEPTYTFVYHYK
jgi:uncharacterized protein YkwD